MIQHLFGGRKVDLGPSTPRRVPNYMVGGRPTSDPLAIGAQAAGTQMLGLGDRTPFSIHRRPTAEPRS